MKAIGGFSATGLGILILLVIALSGCGDQSTLPTGVSDVLPDGRAAVLFADSVISDSRYQGMAASSTLDYLKNSPYYCCDAATKNTIDEGGGSLKIQLDNEEIFFVVPRGALTSEVEIEIIGFKMHTPLGDAFVYECFPSGLQFAKPMTVNHPIDRPNGSWAVMLYSGGGQSWSFEQLSVVQNGRALFAIHHFSKYGIS